MYEVQKEKMRAYNGKEVIINHRKGTNDFNTLKSIIEADEYHTKEIGDFDGKVCIDIGAHIGAFPLLLSTIARNAGVYCFEPLPENYQMLFNNLQDNDLQDFGYCHQLAVAHRGRPIAHIYYGDDTPNGQHHKFIGSPVYNPPEGFRTNFVEVETINLTDIFVLNDIQDVHVLKVDAETFEWEIFADTPPEVLDHIKWIIGELHPHPVVEDWHTLEDFLKLLGDKFEVVKFPNEPETSRNFFLKNKSL